MTNFVVVGAGLAGLVAARELSKQGHQVTVLEAAERVGGQIHTIEWHGLPVDTGAEAMFLGAPLLPRLIDEVGLTDQLVRPTPGTSWLRTKRGLTKLPEGVGPTGPTKLKPVLKSRLLSPFALARAGMEPVLARRKITGDISVGDFVTRRFGRAVTETFVDPLLGNLHAGDIDRLSLVSTAPQLLPAAREGRSLVFKKKSSGPGAPGGPGGPGTPGGSGGPGGAPGSPPLSPFASFPTGIQTLTDAIAQDLTIQTNASVRALRRTSEGWDITTDSDTFTAERLVLAVPAQVAAALLEPTVPGITEDLTAGRTADVATILLAYPKAAGETPALRDGNGILLRSSAGRLLKASTFLSRKWTHLRSDDVFLVRASAGRAGVDALSLVDDTNLVKRVHRELAELTDLDHRPLDSLVARWPGSYPQLEVGHAVRMAKIRDTLSAHPVQLVGGPYDGLGMPSVVRSALAVAG
ncbi:MAG: protoporphyrinogen oxidase [Propionibacteriaceae bacterium]|nr:protoporphyrinogen oxidase [Propionibacteriaceae bacterium]